MEHSHESFSAQNKISADVSNRVIDRRNFLQKAAVAGAAALALPRDSRADETDLKPILAEIEKRHDESVERLQRWIKQPSIAAENWPRSWIVTLRTTGKSYRGAAGPGQPTPRNGRGTVVLLA